MQMNASSIVNQKAEWEKLGVKLPAFDHAAMTAATKEHPIWVHFGAGNIFRAFPAAILNDALNSGKMYAAGLDVAAVEPLPATSPLLTAKNCIMTPHIAWATKEARQRLMNIAVDNLRCFLDGKPQNVVNP